MKHLKTLTSEIPHIPIGFFLLNSLTSVQRERILSHSQSLLNLYICFFLSSWILLLPQFSLTAWSKIFLQHLKKVFPLIISQYKWRKTDRTTVFCCQKALLGQLSNLARQLQIFKCREPVCLHSPALLHTVNKVTTFKNIPGLKKIFHLKSHNWKGSIGRAAPRSEALGFQNAQV